MKFKNLLFKLFFLMTIFFICSCSTFQNLPFEDKGWQHEDIDSEDSENAYQFLVSHINSKYPNIIVTDIISVKKQNIGGYNISMICAYHKRNEKQKLLSVLIYKDLHGKFFLRKINFSYR